MRPFRLICVTGLIAAALMPFLSAQDPPPDPNVEVLTRGPVHEAYANAVTSQPAPGLLAPKQPPAPIEELPPDEKPAGENVQWIPGYWAWDEDKQDFLWVSGFWRVPPPNRTWVPGVWHDAGNGQWQWTGGFWNESRRGQRSVPAAAAGAGRGRSAAAARPGLRLRPRHLGLSRHALRLAAGILVRLSPGWVYMPAHYSWTPYGYIFVDGYWDYPLRQRGVLFTPVYFSAGVYARPGFVYTPRYVVYDDALYGRLVRPARRRVLFRRLLRATVHRRSAIAAGSAFRSASAPATRTRTATTRCSSTIAGPTARIGRCRSTTSMSSGRDSRAPAAADAGAAEHRREQHHQQHDDHQQHDERQVERDDGGVR